MFARKDPPPPIKLYSDIEGGLGWWRDTEYATETPKFIMNSLVFCAIAVALCIVIGVPMAWIMARTTAPGRGAMDALTTLILAIPGTAIGIAYIRAFHYPLPFIDTALTSMWIILPLVLAFDGLRRYWNSQRVAEEDLRASEGRRAA